MRRFGNSESIQDLPQSREPNQHRVSLLSTDNNRFIGAIESEDHPSAHVNPALINGEQTRLYLFWTALQIWHILISFGRICKCVS